MSKQLNRKTNNQKHLKLRFNWKTVIAIFLVGGFIYLVLPHIGEFHNSLKLLKNLKLSWLVITVAASLATYGAAAGIYLALAKHSLKYFPTLIIQSAGMLANRLLPGGVGSLGVNYEYLRKHHHSVTEAGSVIATNNICGLVGHLLIFMVVLIFFSFHLRPVSLPHPSSYVYWLFGAVLLLVVILLAWSRKLRSELFQTILGVLRNIGRYRTHPLRLAMAIVVSMTLTLLYVVCLAACGEALNIHLAFGQVFLVMTAGVITGTVTPTPGGLLGAEAGLLAALVAYGVVAAPALAVVLMYRLITYWFALLMGAVAFILSERLGYL